MHIDGQQRGDSEKVNEAIQRQKKVVHDLRGRGDSPVQFPVLLVESAGQLARWLEARGHADDDREALKAFKEAEEVVLEHLGAEDAKAVELKRDVALLHLKLGDHETALQYLNDVHYYERRLHGSQSTSVARTLKALGTVHMVRRNLQEAERCLLQALRIFGAEHPTHAAIVKDIHAK